MGGHLLHPGHLLGLHRLETGGDLDVHLELIEVVAGRQIAEVEVDELTIPDSSPLVGMTVRDSEARNRYGLLIVAVRSADGQLAFNPDADTVFQGEDTVIVMGRLADIERFREEYTI